MIDGARELLRLGSIPNDCLYEKLEDPDDAVRLMAIRVLAETADEQTPCRLHALLPGRTSVEHCALLEALAVLDAPQAPAAARQALEDRDARVRRVAVAALRQLQCAGDVALLLDLIAREHVREVLVEALIAVIDLAGHEPLIALWKDLSTEARLRLFVAMRQGAPLREQPRRAQTVAMLRAILGAGEPVVIRSALGLMALLGAEEFRDELEILAESDHEAIAQAAQALLRDGRLPEADAQPVTCVDGDGAVLDRIATLADEHVEVARDLFGREMDFTEESIHALDEIICRGWPGERLAHAQQAVLLFGSYLGETIRRSLGGEWRYSERFGFHLAVGPHAEVTAFPFAKVKRCLREGGGESLGGFFRHLKQVLGESPR